MTIYLEHFGLNEPPFKITPHTEFFFAGANRGETLEALMYAITSGEGMVKVTGEVGAGKTMLVTALGLLLGGRADTGAVRTGARAARVEGVVRADAKLSEIADEHGGEVESGSLVDEQWLLDLERREFMALLRDQRTQARVAHTLATGKPLRN